MHSPGHRFSWMGSTWRPWGRHRWVTSACRLEARWSYRIQLFRLSDIEWRQGIRPFKSLSR